MRQSLMPLTDDRQHIKIRGRRYTAPPLTSTCSVVCQSYSEDNNTGGKKLKNDRLANTTSFITALVAFAERRVIKMNMRFDDIQGAFQYSVSNHNTFNLSVPNVRNFNLKVPEWASAEHMEQQTSLEQLWQMPAQLKRPIRRRIAQGLIVLARRISEDIGDLQVYQECLAVKAK